MGVGINLSSVHYYGTDAPFIDRMKTSSNWNAKDAKTYTGTNLVVPLDANGAPTGLPTGTMSVSTILALDPPDAGTSHRYVLTFTGDAKFDLLDAKIVSQKPGEIVFEWNGKNAQSILTMMPGSSGKLASDLHLVREDQVSLFKAGEIFNPALLDKVASFADLRFMDWGNTNNSTLTSWSQRTTADSLSWAANSSTASVPIEVMVALANKTGKNMWFNVPAQADDQYVRNALTYIRDHLDPNLTVKIEYSNEVWNTAFQQNQYAVGQAVKLWGVDANHDGKIDPNDSKEVPYDGAEQYYGYRSAQIAAITDSVFGTNAKTRAENVIAIQADYKGREQNILSGVARANVGTTSQLFEDLATTVYFGSQLGGATSADQAKILSWANSGSAGIDAAFRELASGGALSSNRSLDVVLGYLSYQASVAKSNGLKFVTYEGGVDLVGFRFDTADQPTVTAFFDKLAEDPRMGALYTKAIDGFKAAGGVEFNAFDSVGAGSIWGNYGVLDSIYTTGSARYDALVAAAKLGDSAPLAPVATLAPLAAPVVNHDFFGDSYDNRIVGTSGADRMAGGTGHDTYVVDDAGDVINEKAGEGIDTVETTLAAYTLGSNLENLKFTGASGTFFTGTGNELDNTITGGNAGNMLSGGAGNDILYGGNGNDTLDGGTGSDRMSGGNGNDLYIVDSVYDVVTENVGGGTDEIRTTLNKITMFANVENLTYVGGDAFIAQANDLSNVIRGGDSGNKIYAAGGNDTVYGGAGADMLDGGAGVDILYGMGGDDLYFVDNNADVVIEGVNGGHDTVNTTASFTLSANVEDLVVNYALSAFGSASLTLTGNDLDNVITGGGGNDIIDGGAGADTVRAGDGNDYVLGGTGNDLLSGGAGDDTLVGGGGDDQLYGDVGNDVLTGGAGADRLEGGAGADRFVFSNLSDLSPTLSLTDRIVDFRSSEGDKIDLRGFDANSIINAVQAFNFVGSNLFSHHAGELRAVTDKWGNSVVSGDVNGDGVADFTINVSTLPGWTLSRSDFIL